MQLIDIHVLHSDPILRASWIETTLQEQPVEPRILFEGRRIETKVGQGSKASAQWKNLDEVLTRIEERGSLEGLRYQVFRRIRDAAGVDESLVFDGIVRKTSADMALYTIQATGTLGGAEDTNDGRILGKGCWKPFGLKHFSEPGFAPCPYSVGAGIGWVDINRAKQGTINGITGKEFTFSREGAQPGDWVIAFLAGPPKRIAVGMVENVANQVVTVDRWRFDQPEEGWSADVGPEYGECDRRWSSCSTERRMGGNASGFVLNGPAGGPGERRWFGGLAPDWVRAEQILDTFMGADDRAQPSELGARGIDNFAVPIAYGITMVHNLPPIWWMPDGGDSTDAEGRFVPMFFHPAAGRVADITDFRVGSNVHDNVDRSLNCLDGGDPSDPQDCMRRDSYVVWNIGLDLDGEQVANERRRVGPDDLSELQWLAGYGCRASYLKSFRRALDEYVIESPTRGGDRLGWPRRFSLNTGEGPSMDGRCAVFVRMETPGGWGGNQNRATASFGRGAQLVKRLGDLRVGQVIGEARTRGTVAEAAYTYALTHGRTGHLPYEPDWVEYHEFCRGEVSTAPGPIGGGGGSAGPGGGGPAGGGDGGEVDAPFDGRRTIFPDEFRGGQVDDDLMFVEGTTDFRAAVFKELALPAANYSALITEAIPVNSGIKGVRGYKFRTAVSVRAPKDRAGLNGWLLRLSNPLPQGAAGLDYLIRRPAMRPRFLADGRIQKSLGKGETLALILACGGADWWVGPEGLVPVWEWAEPQERIDARPVLKVGEAIVDRGQQTVKRERSKIFSGIELSWYPACNDYRRFTLPVINDEAGHFITKNRGSAAQMKSHFRLDLPLVADSQQATALGNIAMKLKTGVLVNGVFTRPQVLKFAVRADWLRRAGLDAAGNPRPARPLRDVFKLDVPKANVPDHIKHVVFKEMVDDGKGVVQVTASPHYNDIFTDRGLEVEVVGEGEIRHGDPFVEIVSSSERIEETLGGERLSFIELRLKAHK